MSEAFFNTDDYEKDILPATADDNIQEIFDFDLTENNSEFSNFLNKIPEKPSFLKLDYAQYETLMEFEECLLNENINQLKKIKIIQDFHNLKAIPDQVILNYLMIKPGEIELKTAIVSYFISYIYRSTLKQILQNRNYTRFKLKLETLKHSAIRNDLDPELIDYIVNDKIENFKIRTQAIEVFSSKIKIAYLEKIIKDTTENLTLRLLCLKKASVRFDLDLGILEHCLRNKNENIKIKLKIVTIFKNRLPLEILKNYFLDKTLDSKEKLLILKAIYDKLSELNKDGTLNMLFLMMQDYAQGQKFLLQEKILGQEFIGELLTSNKISKAVKEEIISSYKDQLNSKLYKSFINELLLDQKMSSYLKKYFLTNFNKLITTETIIKLIAAKENSAIFRKYVMQTHKNKIRFSHSALYLRPILLDTKDDLSLRKNILKTFYNYFSPETFYIFLNLELPDIKPLRTLLLALNKLGFFNTNDQILHRLLKNKTTSESAGILTIIFQEYLTDSELASFAQALAFNKKELLKVLIELQSEITRLKIICSVLTNFHFKDQSFKYNITSSFFEELPANIIATVLQDPELDSKYKILILNNNGVKNDLNKNGVLDFMVSDTLEDPQLRSLILTKYQKQLNQDILFTIKNNPHETEEFRNLI